MKVSFGLMALCLATTTLAGQAFAADLPQPVDAPIITQLSPASTWAGFYAGVFYGGAATTFHTKQGSSKSNTEYGQTGGGLIGYNFQSGRFVYGPEADIGLHVVRGTNGGGDDLAASDVDSMYSARLRARLGYDMGSIMPFIAGGVAMNETYQHDPNAEYGDVQRLWGWTAGAGVDWKLNAPVLGSVVLRGEYVYEGYPEETFRYGGQSFKTREDTHIVRAAVIWRPGEKTETPTETNTGNVDWAGAYGGLLGGGSWAKTHTKGNGGSTSFDADGGLGGIYLGYNYMFGNWLLGAEGDISLADLTGSGDIPGGGDDHYRGNVDADLRLRAGYAVGRFLPFVAGGVNFARSEQKDEDTGSEKGRVPTDSWTVGGGLDYKLTDHVSVRGEYRYASTLKSVRLPVDDCNCRQDQDSHTVRFGAAYHFQ
ncbi:Opacity protein [Faunimonas pinastri]|uniref:Opacity protein n=1 Tax=Faunimonas pinastri TaxID=1855383 RepID=A0A1H9P1X2_9HYPH|nr:outer membrane beta-barrel protein [Faunimonas pinastri]SER42111.1 Opacity protein [Faunimonas pinastri]